MTSNRLLSLLAFVIVAGVLGYSLGGWPLVAVVIVAAAIGTVLNQVKDMRLRRRLFVAIVVLLTLALIIYLALQGAPFAGGLPK